MSGDVGFVGSVDGIRFIAFVYGWIGLRDEIWVYGLRDGLCRYIYVLVESLIQGNVIMRIQHQIITQNHD